MAIDCDDSTFLETRLATVEAQIVSYGAAITAVQSGQSYRLDTGQTTVSVTRANLTELRRTMDSLWSERAWLRQQLGCSGTVVMTPGF